MRAGPGRVVSAESRSERGARVVGPSVSGEDGASKVRPGGGGIVGAFLSVVGDGPACSLLGLGASDPLSGISAPRKEPNTWARLCPTALFRMTEDEMSLGMFS